jgi:hypothetical protein
MTAVFCRPGCTCGRHNEKTRKAAAARSIARSKNRRGAPLFFRTYPGPVWTCYFCGEDVTSKGRGSNDLQIHHLNGNNKDNWIENMVPAHARCHIKYHRKLRPDIQRIGALAAAEARRGKPMPQEVRDKISQSHMGKPKSHRGKPWSPARREAYLRTKEQHAVQ